MATHKTNQLDINLSQVGDIGTREALTSIVRFVNDMTQNISVNKGIKAKRFATQDEYAVIEADGCITAKMLEFDKGGKFKVMVVSDTLSQSASRTVNVPSSHKILGVFGWTQVNTTSVWRPMPTATATNLVYITTTGDNNTVIFTNSDADSANSFCSVIFYTKGR